MRKISFVLAAIMAIALNCNAQSSNGCYRGFIDAGYSIGVGDYEFGRFEVNTSHGYHEDCDCHDTYDCAGYNDDCCENDCNW